MEYHASSSWHATNKATCVVVADKRKACADMTTVRARTGKVLCYFDHINIPMVDLDKKLDGTLQPHIKATYAGGFYDRAIVQIPQPHVLLPAHQKSSAEGMRV
jgi:hypothetical protein